MKNTKSSNYTISHLRYVNLAIEDKGSKSVCIRNVTMMTKPNLSYQVLYAVVNKDKTFQLWKRLFEVLSYATRNRAMMIISIPCTAYHILLLFAITVLSRVNKGNPSNFRISLSEKSIVSN